jgi:hypothetical protein
MARPPLPPDLLKVPVTAKLERDGVAFYRRQVAAGDFPDDTAALDAHVRHLRLCAKAFTLVMPPQAEASKQKVSARLDPSSVAWIREQRRARRFGSDADAINYALAHGRVCKAEPSAKTLHARIHGASVSNP